MKNTIESIQTVVSDPQDVNQTKQSTKITLKIIISRIILLILIALAAMGCWQIHNLVVQRNDNQTSIPAASYAPTLSPSSLPTSSPTLLPTSPTPSPTSAPTSVADANDLKIFLQHLNPSFPMQTFLLNWKEWKPQLFQMEQKIKHFMDQKTAVIQTFQNATFEPDAALTEWYLYVKSVPNPTIDFDRQRHSIKLNIQSLCDLSGEVFGTCTERDGSLTKIYTVVDDITGTIDFTSLPSSLETWEMWQTKLSGNVDLTSLPETLHKLILIDNEFSGSIDLTSLPQSLRELNLHLNKFSGTVNLTKLPASLTRIDLGFNRINIDNCIGLAEAQKNRTIII